MTDELGTAWNVEAVASVTDGDTARLIRSRVVEIDGRRYRLTDDNPKGTPIRLVWVDTPERRAGSLEAWGRARDDLMTWVEDHGDTLRLGKGLRVVCYESAGWDRLLGDLIDAGGNSASQWLMTERGWPPYQKGK